MWENILNNAINSTLLVAAIAFVGRSVFMAILNKDVDGFKIRLQKDCSLEIEELRHALELERQKKVLEFGNLHEKRAELIAELYTGIYDIELHIRKLKIAFGRRISREETDQKFFREKRSEWAVVEGIDTLSEEEEKILFQFHDAYMKVIPFFYKHMIYFPQSVCTIMDQYSKCANYIADNYVNMALKDNQGNIFVAPEVQELWDLAKSQLPTIRGDLEQQFRRLLGEPS